MKDRVRYITMEGEVIQNLCLLRISGGRNVALKQSTSQTSTYGNNERYVSSKAVDGISNGQDIANSCTNTNSGDRSPSWTVTFQPTRLITRIVIYNRKEAPVHLKRFRLQMFNESNRNIFRYTHLNSLGQQVHTLLPLADSPTKTLTIIALTQKEGLYLALCEVEAYGECSRGLWGLECNNTCDDDCPDNCRFDDGSCTDVCFGFENPPVCNKTCAADKWGENCNKTCDQNCHNSACNIMTGQCEQGCRPGYEMPDCKENCARGTWGYNSQNVCSSNCYIKDYCDKATGECIAGCESGYKQPLCDTPAEPRLNTTLIKYLEEATTENVPHDNLNIGVASLAGLLGFIILICGIMVVISYLRKKYLCDRNHVANADVNLYANIHSYNQSNDLYIDGEHNIVS